MYLCLLSYAEPGGISLPGQQRLADDLGISVDTVQRTLTELSRFGLITPQRRGHMLPNCYQLAPLTGNPRITPAAPAWDSAQRQRE